MPILVVFVCLFASPAMAFDFQKSWKEVRSLSGKNQYKKARKKIDVIYAEAVRVGNDDQIMRGLFEMVKLTVGLHGYDKAVRLIYEKKWPTTQKHRGLLHLFRANVLVTYYRSYSWEIQKREKVVSKKIDLKKWTAEEIFERANADYLKAWKMRKFLARFKLLDTAEYLTMGSYPKSVYSTVADFLTYSWVEFLANSQTWTPEQTNFVYKLPLAKLIHPKKRETLRVALVPTQHPLLRINTILLEHRKSGWFKRRSEPQVDNLVQYFEVLHNNFTQAKQREQIRQAAARQLQAYRKFSWWAFGQYKIATWLRDDGKNVEAIKVCQETLDKSGSIGAKNCRSLIAGIQQPHFSFQNPANEGQLRPAIHLSYRNLKKMYFRVYEVDLDKALRDKKWNLHNGWQIRREQFRDMKHVKSWTTNLKETKDYKSRTINITPAIAKKGYYLIVGSGNPDFSSKRNKISYTTFNVTDLFAFVQHRKEFMEVGVRKGINGEPVSAQVQLYDFHWQKGARKVKTYTANKSGYARIPYSAKTRSYNHFFIVKKGFDRFVSQGIYFNKPGGTRPYSRFFVFTDRSIYRPQQTIHFKILGTKKDWKESPKPFSGIAVTVALYDMNNKLVAEKTVKTNAYGTGAGTFLIPKGRTLGRWRVAKKNDWGSSSYVQVEEYKRPTFLVEVTPPKKEYRLNQKVTVKGTARYYFGLPVQGAKAKYSVTRSPVYPWWFWWRYRYWGMTRATAEVIASGTVSLNSKGEFQVPFLPEADPTLKEKKSVNYSFSVDVTVTDEGGESRSGKTSLNIGFVGVQGAIQQEDRFFLEGEKPKFSVRRSNLAGQAREGAGSVRIVRLKLPSEVQEEYRNKEAISKGKTPPLWTPPLQAMQEMFRWENGQQVFSQKLNHDKMGMAEFSLAQLKPGVYRVLYETRDKWGGKFTTQKEFVVASEKMKFPVARFAMLKNSENKVGQTATLFLGTGYRNQGFYLERHRSGKIESRTWVAPKKGQGSLRILKLPIKAKDRGGYTYKVVLSNGYRLLDTQVGVFVPYDNKQLDLKFKTFRDLIRPGAKERWTLSIRSKSGKPVRAETLAYMYDKSLDQFQSHSYPSLASLYPSQAGAVYSRALQSNRSDRHLIGDSWSIPYGITNPQRARFQQVNRYGVGGLGSRGYGRFNYAVEEEVDSMAMADVASSRVAQAPMKKAKMMSRKVVGSKEYAVAGKMEQKKDRRREDQKSVPGESAGESNPLRSNFSETAFFKPQLVSKKDGSVDLSFTVPDSVTTWRVLAHAHTKDLSYGMLGKDTVSQKELMIRPYMPRFYRENDQGILKVTVNNATQGKNKRTLSGKATLKILDLNQNKKDVSKLFGVIKAQKRFSAKSGGSGVLEWNIKVPPKMGQYAVKIVASAKGLSDGELRPFPVLPSRLHLFQSKFVTLKDKDKRKIIIEDLKKAHLDKTLIHDSYVVTVDGQLIYTVLKALPYLINYPYECVEQTLNRFLSTSIVHSTFNQFPSIKKMAKNFLKTRKTLTEVWQKDDPNRKMGLEETPWMAASEGHTSKNLIPVFDPKIVAAQKANSLKKLKEWQLPDGGFPWFPGGPANVYMTLYALHGFAKAYEHKVDVPKSMVQKAINYIVIHEYDKFCRPWSEYGTFFNYILSTFPKNYYQSIITETRRDKILGCSWAHWKKHSPYGKAYLALTLKRKDRVKDAKTVMAAIMDSSTTKQDEGTYWAPEDYGWLWYNDRIESHAFTLRALMEVDPSDKRADGLALWLLLNKKLNQWKSTRATAEVIYALLYYMKAEGSLGNREVINVNVGGNSHKFVFEPDEYTGEKNRIVVEGPKVSKKHAVTEVSKKTKGFAFASAMWHYSTEELPKESRGDFLKVTRKYFKRKLVKKRYQLFPLAEGASIAVGDQMEVHLTIKTRHQFEYVHLRDPRGAGFEPESVRSGYRWDTIGHYEEIRDSATNFFFGWLPQGEYNFKYRIRATMAGQFRVGPATLQSMYAPEFGAFSSGKRLTVK